MLSNTVLSVIVITKDEADRIGRCLESVAWADEIIVLDSGSTDQTVSIARQYTENVVGTDWPGFGKQKNRALEMATGDWILSLDADEMVTPDLRSELEAAMADPDGKAAFRMPRRSCFCGRYMRHSGWWPDYVTRLVRRGEARFSDDLVHERLIPDGPVGTLSAPLMHDTADNLDEVLGKMNLYTTASARMLHQRGRRGTLTNAVLHGLWAFLRTYFFRGGILDGREGFMLAVANAEGSYYRYLKLMLFQENQSCTSQSSSQHITGRTH